VLVTSDIINGTKNQTFKDQEEFIKKISTTAQNIILKY
jgi:hypothetical protein